MNRGPRVGGVVNPEDTSKYSPPLANIAVGDTFVFFVNAISFQSQAANPMFPPDTDYIPSFTIVELLIAPRNFDQAVKGRMINVKSLRESTTTFDAVFQHGTEIGLPATAEAGALRAAERKSLYPSMHLDLEAEKTCFVVPAHLLTYAYMGDIPIATVDIGAQTDMAALANPQEYIKVCIGGMTTLSQCDYVDVKLDMIKKQTNTGSIEHGCAMLDVAFAMGAVNLVVCYDPRWLNRGSAYRAIPVIDTDKLFALLKNVRGIEDGYATVASSSNGVILTDELGIEVTTRIQLQYENEDDDADEDHEQGRQILALKTDTKFDDGYLELKVKVSSEDTSKMRDYKGIPSNSALSIVGLGMSSSKAYPFAFGVVCTNPDDNTDGIVQAFLARGQQINGISRKRKSRKMVI